MSEIKTSDKHKIIIQYITLGILILSMLFSSVVILNSVNIRVENVEKEISELKEEKADNQSVEYFKELVERIEKKVDSGFQEIKSDIKDIKNKG